MRQGTAHRLESAFLATDYEVEGPAGRFVVRIGEVCSSIPADQWAVVTACNPLSQLLSKLENETRMQELARAVRSAGYSFWRGENRARDQSWPPEPSLLVLEIPRQLAVALGRRFEQWAIVVGRWNQRAELVWCHDGKSTPGE